MLSFLGKTDIGNVRTTNQDSYACERLPENAVLLIVCDGMGGHKGGDVASSIAVKHISGVIVRNYTPEITGEHIKKLLGAAISDANRVIIETASRSSELSGMGTTATVAVIKGDAAHIAHIGDSRGYHITHSGITQLTSDHTVAQLLYDCGEITIEEAEHHPKKHYLTKALGAAADIVPDCCEIEFGKDDILILCTDGLTNYIADEELFDRIAFDTQNRRYICENLINLAKERGGNDNITVCAAFCEQL